MKLVSKFNSLKSLSIASAIAASVFGSTMLATPHTALADGVVLSFKYFESANTASSNRQTKNL